MSVRYSLEEWESWDQVPRGFVLGEDDDGVLWLPSLRWKDGERLWLRRFTPWNPLHWPRYWNTLRRRALVMLERVV